MATHVGLDMSLTSPGVAIKVPGVDTIHLLGFQQRVTDEKVEAKELGDKLLISRLPYPLEQKDRWTRCTYVVDTILQWIEAQLGEGPHEVKVYIENYAFGMSGSSSVTKLAELGGCIRYHITKKAGWSFYELSPGQIKKHFAGDGRAKKDAMLKAYQKDYPLMDTLLRIKSHQHPQEDMIDALATLLTGMHGNEKKKRTLPEGAKKRKKT